MFHYKMVMNQSARNIPTNWSSQSCTMIRHVFLAPLVIAFAALSTFAESDTDPEPPFEGRIDYRIMNDGMEWNYSLWIKGALWRAELRQGNTLYELRLGDTSTPTAYLVNEGGKTYRPLFFTLRPPPQPGRRDTSKPQAAVDLSKAIVPDKETKSIAGRVAKLTIVKGPGSKMNVWLNREFGAYSGYAIPVFKKTQDKIPIFVPFLHSEQALPLAIEERGKSGKKAFSMTAISITPMALDEEFLSLPADYTPQGSGPGGPAGAVKGNRSGKGGKGNGPKPR